MSDDEEGMYKMSWEIYGLAESKFMLCRPLTWCQDAQNGSHNYMLGTGWCRDQGGPCSMSALYKYVVDINENSS